MRTLRAILICLLVSLLTPCLFAHDGSIAFDISLDDTPYLWEHEDFSPFKGFASVTVTNTGTEVWGDFHFGFYDPLGNQDISSLAFFDAAGGGVDPTSSQSGLTWAINNNAVGATLDLYFYSDPVGVGEQATFTVYTDNTTDQLPWFGLMIYPTPVPEPATIALLALGGFALRRKRRA